MNEEIDWYVVAGSRLNHIHELEHALKTASEAHHTALEVERAKVRELEAKIDTITTDVNYEGGVQFWIKKHDSLAISMAELVNKYGELEAANQHVEILRNLQPQAEAECAQMKAALAELIRSINECDQDHNLPPLSADFGKGWLSPDGAAKLQAQCAAMREAFRAHLKLTDELKGRELPVEKRWFDEIVNARFEVEKALSATAGQELLSRLERYEKALKEIIAHVRFPDTWGDDLELKECVKMANEAMKGGGK